MPNFSFSIESNRFISGPLSLVLLQHTNDDMHTIMLQKNEPQLSVKRSVHMFSMQVQGTSSRYTVGIYTAKWCQVPGTRTVFCTATHAGIQVTWYW